MVTAAVTATMAAVVASLLAPVSTVVVPLVVAVIMGGPAWLTARKAREEGNSNADLILERLDRIESKVDDLRDWRAGHEVRHRFLDLMLAPVAEEGLPDVD